MKMTAYELLAMSEETNEEDFKLPGTVKPVSSKKQVLNH